MFTKIRFAVVVVVLVGMSAGASGQQLRVKDLPVPEGAGDVSIMKRRGDVRFMVTTYFKTTGNFYAKKLTELRWRKSARDNLQRNFWVQTFAKDKMTLEVRVDSRGGGSEVRLTPNGLMWEEDDQPSPKDLPLPKDATEIEYDDFFESIEMKSPSDVKTLADTLSKELVARNWTKAANEYDLETFVRMKFTQGKSTLNIDIRKEDHGSEVAIKTKGMQWDGMEAEIERANKLAKAAKEKAAKIAEAAEKEAAEKEEAAKVAALPKRKDKPKQGIDQMPKLSNEGTVVMDGKTFKLTNVIAYEAFESGGWSTKIVATERPVKQDSLLARLKRTGADKDKDGNPPSWPQPFLQVELDEDDRPTRLSLQASSTPGGGSGNDLDGAALVEDGRARGTVKLKKPGDFFDKVYTAEISFDVPVLTRDSTPARRLAGAPRLANAGTLTLGNRTYRLTSAVAYPTKQFDEPVTAIVLSERPLNVARIKAAMGKKSIEDYFEFVPQVRLIVDADDKVRSQFIWADNTSLSGNESLAGDVAIEAGRARGSVKMAEAGEFFDKKYTFAVSFDVDVLGTPASGGKAPPPPAGGLVADSRDGLPIPEGYQGIQKEGSKFRSETKTTVSAELGAVVAFYRRELPAAGWKENVRDASIDNQAAKLSFSGPEGSLTVQLKAGGKETAITLASRHTAAAKAAGLLPSAGKGRMVIGNGHDQAATVTVNKRPYNVAAGAGARDPKTGINWEVAPGKYTVEIKLPGGSTQTETVTIGAGETWGVMILPTGAPLAVQVY
jgi:hypothetical protein